MKRIFNLMAGLAIIVLATSAVSIKATTKISAKPASIVKKDNFLFYGFFGVTTTPDAGGGGYYDATVTFFQYNTEDGVITPGPCPTDVSIEITSGPFEYATFTFPSGNTSFGLGKLPIPGNPAGTNVPITTSPTTAGAYPIEQTLYGGTFPF